jgi:hypothetical protein
MPILPCSLLFLFLVVHFRHRRLFLSVLTTAAAAVGRRDSRLPLLVLHPQHATTQAFLFPQRPQHRQQRGQRMFVALLHLPG